ncbi:hypothetical protein GBA52_028456 [Prunus armeniaca]|nr:hypothetical protein GBA52_028456 [Prunus armeniaca]
MKVQQNSKRCMEFAALCNGQEIHAHKGLKATLIANLKKIKSGYRVIFPDKGFRIEESPLQEFHGHSSDVLDLAWSNSNALATSMNYQCYIFLTSGVPKLILWMDREYLQLAVQMHIHGRTKTSGNQITGIQFSQEKLQRVMITSEDSKIRIFEGVELIKKYKGLPPKSGCQMSTSFTSNGKHIISVGEDSHVYLWDHDGFCVSSSKQIRSVKSCEYFFCEGVSVAVPGQA